MSVTPALLQALLTSPPLIEKLPESDPFPINRLSLPPEIPDLNLAQKLGQLYEDALAFLLDSSPKYDLLARNLQIQKDQHTTLGELDFLLRDLSSGQLIHLELATKFYLAIETENGLQLPGPDARDNYFKKLARLRSHQLQLPVLFNEHLPAQFRDEPIITQHLVQGCLFDHPTSQKPATAEHLSPNCRRGKWLHSTELQNHFPTDTTFELIPKPLWPIPLEILQNIPLDPWTPDAHITRCQMIRANDQSQPIFIVPARLSGMLISIDSEKTPASIPQKTK